MHCLQHSKKLSGSGTSNSLDKITSLEPFFITYPTEKEISLCLCKLSLKIKMLLGLLMPKAKRVCSGLSRGLRRRYTGLGTQTMCPNY